MNVQSSVTHDTTVVVKPKGNKRLTFAERIKRLVESIVEKAMTVGYAIIVVIPPKSPLFGRLSICAKEPTRTYRNNTWDEIRADLTSFLTNLLRPQPAM